MHWILWDVLPVQLLHSLWPHTCGPALWQVHMHLTATATWCAAARPCTLRHARTARTPHRTAPVPTVLPVLPVPPHRYDFLAREAEVAALEGISVSDVVQWWATYLAAASPARRKLVVHVTPTKQCDAHGPVPPPGSTDGAAVGGTGGTKAVEVVEDLAAFKASCGTYPVVLAPEPLQPVTAAVTGGAAAVTGGAASKGGGSKGTAAADGGAAESKAGADTKGAVAAGTAAACSAGGAGAAAGRKGGAGGGSGANTRSRAAGAGSGAEQGARGAGGKKGGGGGSGPKAGSSTGGRKRGRDSS